MQIDSLLDLQGMGVLACMPVRSCTGARAAATRWCQMRGRPSKEVRDSASALRQQQELRRRRKGDAAAVLCYKGDSGGHGMQLHGQCRQRVERSQRTRCHAHGACIAAVVLCT